MAFLNLSPHIQWRNPVMFVTYVGAIATVALVIQGAFKGSFSPFNLQIACWLILTVLFANFAEAMATSRGKAQAAGLRRIQHETYARRVVEGREEAVRSCELQKGDLIVCSAGDLIPADGEVVEGVAAVDESAITGESAPVIRESGGDRSAVTAGTRLVSDRLIIKVTAESGTSFLAHMIVLIEGASRQKIPSEIALSIILSGLTLIFLLTVSSLKLFSLFSGEAGGADLSSPVTLPILISLLVCLIPTTISSLLGAIAIAGMDRLIQRNVIAKSGRSIEAAGDIDLLIMDKTGTITMGNRMAYAFLPARGVSERELAEVAQLASLADETPEGRSIVVLSKSLFGLRGDIFQANRTKLIPFSAQTRMSGVDFLSPEGQVTRRIRKGAVQAIRSFIEAQGGIYSPTFDLQAREIAKEGGTPLLVSDDNRIVGLIHLKDTLKGGIKARIEEMRRMGIRTLMITGDNPLTAAAIALESGVDDYVAEATPESKLTRIKEEQAKGLLVAMAGDGTNDAPALAQADIGMAMNTGTQASREAGNMVDLDSNPTKLIEIVGIGKGLLMTRGALTTFSIANDLAKYFAIIPALFGGLYASDGSGPLIGLNIMRLHSPESAILSAVIFNALIIIALIPLALQGVHYKPQSAQALLRSNLLIYGVGGIIAPFVGIKVIDLLIHGLGLTH